MAQDDDQNELPKPSLRTRTFLKGIVYYDNRSASIDCTVRDFSDSGARIVFSTAVIVPDEIELHIPQKQLTLPARVRRREQYEVGVSFADKRSDIPRRTADGELADRVKKVESELVAMKRAMKRLMAKVFPNDSDI